MPYLIRPHVSEGCGRVYPTDGGDIVHELEIRHTGIGYGISCFGSEICNDVKIIRQLNPIRGDGSQGVGTGSWR